MNRLFWASVCWLLLNAELNGQDAPQTPLNPRATATSWPICRGDAQATGVAASNLPEKLDLLWKFSVESAFDATPAVADGRIYIGDLDEKLYALDLKTGQKLWEQPGKLGFPGGPAVQENRVYAGDGDGIFHCYAADSGKELWQFATEDEIVAGANFWKDQVLIGSQDSKLYSLHAVSGKLSWKLAIDNQIRTLTTVVNDRAFVAQCDGKLHVIDLPSGAITATVPLEQPNTTSNPAVLGDRLYCGTEEGSLVCIDWNKAAIAWTASGKGNAQAFRSSPAVASDLVVIGSRGKRVFAFSPADGNEKWSFATKNRVDSSPVIVGTRILIGSADGRLYALDRVTGRELWNYECQGSINSGVAVADGKVVVATEKGHVYCFGAQATP